MEASLADKLTLAVPCLLWAGFWVWMGWGGYVKRFFFRAIILIGWIAFGAVFHAFTDIFPGIPSPAEFAVPPFLLNKQSSSIFLISRNSGFGLLESMTLQTSYLPKIALMLSGLGAHLFLWRGSKKNKGDLADKELAENSVRSTNTNSFT